GHSCAKKPSWSTPPTAGIVVDDRPKEASGNKQRPAPQIDAIIRDSTDTFGSRNQSSTCFSQLLAIPLNLNKILL
ncbi:hypothetical protein, partial [Halothiobacillus sp.]|uniref:hypothetical protein n=1 Tax=Halothiobacillus sp. TaxID=1891311 RepID=UPI002AD3B8B7